MSTGAPFVDAETGEMRVHPAADLFPMVGPEELSTLADDIKERGLLEPLWIYDDPDLGVVLLDGRNRFRACSQAEVEPTFRTYEGDDPIGFVLSLNLHRRHLTTGQRAAVANDALPLYEAAALRRKAEAGASSAPGRASTSQGHDKGSDGDAPAEEKECATRHTLSDSARKAIANAAQSAKRRAADDAAAAAGTSGRSVARFKRLAEEAPDLAGKVRSGEIELGRAERIIRDRLAEAERIKRAEAEAAAQKAKPTIDLRLGDFREVLADLSDVDAIITDPPYPAEFLPLYDDLAIWADKVLGPDGVMVVLVGQTHLPDVLRRLDGGRPYRWCGNYSTPGASYQSHARRVACQWKPFLVYGRGPHFFDVVSSSGDDKANHKWGQNLSAFEELVRRFTAPGATVVDPFAGGGTTLLAAYATGRHSIGAELDPSAYKVAKERLP